MAGEIAVLRKARSNPNAPKLTKSREDMTALLVGQSMGWSTSVCSRHVVRRPASFLS
jgi:hypothetical protein